MTPPPVIRRRRADRLTRLGGVAAQFRSRDGDVYVFRKDGLGPPIEVSVAERNTFVRASMWMLGLHIGLLALSLLGWSQVASRLFQDFGEIGGTAVLTAAGWAAAGLLYASLRWTMHAPARALARRPTADAAWRPADGPDPDEPTPYGAILGVSAFVVIWSVFHAQGSLPLVAVVVVSVVLVAPVLALQTWRARRRLTPAQRERIAATRATRRVAERAKTDVKAGLLILLFMAVEIAVPVVALVLGSRGALGTPPEADGLGIIVGLILGLVPLWPIDLLCQRWTGESALAGLREIAGSL